MTKSTNETGYIITRADGSYDGMGDYVIFATREEAERTIAKLAWVGMTVHALGLAELASYAEATTSDNSTDYATAVSMMADDSGIVAGDLGIPRYLVSYWCGAGGPRTPGTSGEGR